MKREQQNSVVQLSTSESRKIERAGGSLHIAQHREWSRRSLFASFGRHGLCWESKRGVFDFLNFF